MLEHGSFLFGVPELFRGNFFPLVVLSATVTGKYRTVNPGENHFFPLVVLSATVTLNAVISLFFGLFKQFITKHIFVYGNTKNS